MTHHSTVALPGNPDMSQYRSVELKENNMLLIY
jgi:hypothetical protein